MRCEEIEPLIEPYLDGAVSEQTADVVAAHLSTCAECARCAASLELESNFYTKHEPELEVPVTFWSGVMERVDAHGSEAQQRTPSWLDRVAQVVSRIRAMSLEPAPAVALLLLTVGLTAAVTFYLSSHMRLSQVSVARMQAEGSTQTTASSPDPRSEVGTDRAFQFSQATASVPAGDRKTSRRPRDPNQQKPTRRETADALVREAEQKYLAAIAMLSQDARGRVARLDPGAKSQFEQTLATIDRAIANTRSIVHASPGDPVAVQYMLTAYSRKVDLLRQVVGD